MSSSIHIWLRAINAFVLLTAVACSTALAADAQAKLLGSVNDTPSVNAVLPALNDKDLSALSERSLHTKVHEVGMGRAAPKQFAKINLKSLTWTGMGDKQFAVVQIKATDAAAVRIGIDRRSFPKGLALIEYGTAMPELVYGPYESDLRSILAAEPYWLPVVEGDTVRLELQLDAGATPSGVLSVPTVSHLVTSVHRIANKNLGDIGDSGSCNIDINCPPHNATWLSRGDAVAKYYETTSSGGTGICTGTLVSNTSSATPIPAYFITANHCVASNARSMSMHFYWFFQRAVCNGPAPTTVTETTGGATFLGTVLANDQTLVVLNNRPPAGAVFAPWTNPGTVTVGQTLVALHHPSGDLKKYSSGTMQNFSGYLDGSSNTTSHIKMLWTQGTTEQGSSGSGLFNATGQFVGTLHGGNAACGANQTQPDWYGRFDQAYPTFAPWLNPGPGGPPPPPTPPAPMIPVAATLNSGVATNGSVAFDALVWYRIDTTAGMSSLNVTLTGLSADADLFLFRNGVTDTPDCDSVNANRDNETCTVNSPGAATWYIGVFGYEAANYTVTASVNSGVPVGSTGGGGGGSMDTTLLALLGLLSVLQANRVRRNRVRH